MKNIGIIIGIIVALAVVLALAIPNNPDAAHGKPIKPLDNNTALNPAIVQLPTEAPRLMDQSLLKLTDKTAANRVTSDMSSRYPRIKNEQDFPALAYVLQDVTDEDTIRHEIANLLRRSDYPNLTNDLITVLNNPVEQERFRNFAVQHIYLNYENADEKERALIKKSLHICLTDRHPAVQREGLLSLHRLKDQGTGKTAKAWLADSEKGAVHDLAIRVLREQGDKTALSEIRELVSAESEVVSIAAIVTLGEWRDKESESTLEELYNSGSQRVQRACELALKRISGELPVSK